MALRAHDEGTDGQYGPGQQLVWGTGIHSTCEPLLELLRKPHAHASIIGEHEQVVGRCGQEAIVKPIMNLPQRISSPPRLRDCSV